MVWLSVLFLITLASGTFSHVSAIGLLVGSQPVITVIERFNATQARLRQGPTVDLLNQGLAVLDELDQAYAESLTQPVSYIPLFFVHMQLSPEDIAAIRTRWKADRATIMKGGRPAEFADPRDPLVKLRALGQELADQQTGGLLIAQEPLRPLLAQDISDLNELLSGTVNVQDIGKLLKAAELIRGVVYNDTNVIQRYVLMHNADTLFGQGRERDVADPTKHPVNLLKKRLWEFVGALRAIPERKKPLAETIQKNLIADAVRLIRALRPLTLYPDQKDIVQERLDDVIPVLDAVINELSVNLAGNRDTAQRLFNTIDVMAGAALGNLRLTAEYERMRANDSLFPEGCAGA